MTDWDQPVDPDDHAAFDAEVAHAQSLLVRYIVEAASQQALKGGKLDPLVRDLVRDGVAEAVAELARRERTATSTQVSEIQRQVLNAVSERQGEIAASLSRLESRKSVDPAPAPELRAITEALKRIEQQLSRASHAAAASTARSGGFGDQRLDERADGGGHEAQPFEDKPHPGFDRRQGAMPQLEAYDEHLGEFPWRRWGLPAVVTVGLLLAAGLGWNFLHARSASQADDDFRPPAAASAPPATKAAERDTAWQSIVRGGALKGEHVTIACGDDADLCSAERMTGPGADPVLRKKLLDVALGKLAEQDHCAAVAPLHWPLNEGSRQALAGLTTCVGDVGSAPPSREALAGDEHQALDALWRWVLSALGSRS